MKPTLAKYINARLLGALALALCAISLVPQVASAASYLFPTQVPTGAFQDYPNGVLGTRFQSDTPGRITALRYYAQAGDNDETTLKLWDAATQTELASVTGTPTGTEGWFEVSLPVAVAVTAGKQYVVSYNAGANGNYAVTSHFFDTALSSGHLSAPVGAGVFADSGFPTQAFGNTCYFADVAFEPTATYRLFPTQVPTGAYQDYPNGVLGTTFQPVKAGWITALRYYAQAGDNDVTTLKLWNAASQTELASVSGTPNGTAGWFEVSLPVAVAVTAGTQYVVSYNAGANGNYAVTSHFFDTALTSGYLTAPVGAGVFADSGFPSQSFGNTCYFADVLFETIADFPTMVVEGNGLTIASGDTTPGTTDGTQFGGTNVNAGVVDHTFTIRNTGSGGLVLSGTPMVGLVGPHSSDFSVSAQPVSPVTPANSTTFTVRFQPLASGLRNASVMITNNAGGVYQFAIQGIGEGSGYRVLGHKAEGSQLATLDYATLTGSRFMALRDMSISQINVKIERLLATTIPQARLKCAIYADQGGTTGRLLGSTVDLVNPATNGWFALNLTAPVNVNVGSSYWLVVLADGDEIVLYADAAAPGEAARTGAQFANSYDAPWPDPIDLPNAFNGNLTLCIYAEGLPLSVVGPEMEVQGGGYWIPAGGTNVTSVDGTDFGTAMLYGGTRESTFTILNVGQASLSLTGAPAATITGPAAGDFAVISQPASSIPSGGNSKLTIRFTPSAGGPRMATVVIPHADSLTAYDFAIQGAGLYPPGAAVLGNDGNGTDSRLNDAAHITGNRFLAPGNLRITELRAKVVALPTGNFGCAVYSDNNGNPGQLLSSTAPVFGATNGWNTFALNSSLDVVGGNFYWLLLWSDTPIVAALQADPIGTAYVGNYSPVDFGAWPDHVSLAPITSEARTYCIYAEGTPLGSVPGPQMNLRGNGKLIVFGDTSPSTLDGTDFGSLAAGIALDHTFTIQNSGATALQLTGAPPVAITGPQAGDFLVTSPPTSPVPPGGSTSFTVRFTPLATGLRLATVTVTNDDLNPDKHAYQFAVRGAGSFTGRESLFPDSKVGGDVDNDITAYALGTIFQASVQGAITQLRVFSVAGDSGEHTAWLWRRADTTQVGGPFVWNFGGVTGWIYLDIPPVNIDALTEYVVSISTGDAINTFHHYANIAADVGDGGNNGLHLSYPPNAGVFIENDINAMPINSWNGSSYLRDIMFVPATNTVPLPVMTVLGGSNLIPDGYNSPSAANNTDFGGASLGGAGVERIFVVTNSGTGPLNLIGSPRVKIQGPQATEFVVVTQPEASVGVGGAIPITIRFVPGATGPRRALVAIENNDKNPYYFSISGAGDAAVEVRITSITTDLSAGNVTLEWNAAGQQFQVERAPAVKGQFQPVGPAQSERVFTDFGVLKTNSQNFYRIRGL
jgi:hypothetical protein